MRARLGGESPIAQRHRQVEEQVVVARLEIERAAPGVDRRGRIRADARRAQSLPRLREPWIGGDRLFECAACVSQRGDPAAPTIPDCSTSSPIAVNA